MSIGEIELPKAEDLKPFKPLNLDNLSDDKLVERDGRLTKSELEANLSMRPSNIKQNLKPENTLVEEKEVPPTSFSLLAQKPNYPMPILPKDLKTEPNSGSIGLVRGEQLSLSVNFKEGGYTVSSLLMSSCQGEIWLVTDPDGRTCALKIQDLSKFLPQKQADRIAKNQIRAYEQLQEKPHPNIVNSF